MPPYCHLFAVLIEEHSSHSAFSRCSREMFSARQTGQYGSFPQCRCSSKVCLQPHEHTMNCQPIAFPLLSATFYTCFVLVTCFKSTTNYLSALLLPSFAGRKTFGKCTGALPRGTSRISRSCSVLAARRTRHYIVVCFICFHG